MLNLSPAARRGIFHNLIARDSDAALLAADTRTPAERRLAALFDARGGNEQGAEPEAVLRAIALELIEREQADRHALQAQGKHPAPCARFCEATAFGIKIRSLEAQLRAALAAPQPAQEPVAPYTGDVVRIMREAGMTFHLGLPHKAVVEQMTRVVDLVYAEASIKAAVAFAAPQPAQEPFAYFNPNVKTQIMGAAERDRYAGRTSDSGGMVAYAKACTAPLYTTPQAPQRQPLTRDLVKKLMAEAGYDMATPQEKADFINGLRHGEIAHGITKGPAA